MTLSLAVTSAVGAQTEPSADSIAILRARIKAARRAQADSALANIGPRITEALRVARASKKTVLVYIADTNSGRFSSRVFENFLHSAEFGPLMNDNFVLVRLTQAEAEPIAQNPKPDSTTTDSTMRALAGMSISVLDSGGRVASVLRPGFNGFPTGMLSTLWAASQRLKQLAPRITEADRKRIVTYLMQWAAGW